MNEKNIENYSELIIKAGVNLQPGQCLTISTGYQHYEFALKLAEAAYKSGAKFVEIETQSDKNTMVRLNNTINKSDVEFVPDYIKPKMYEMISDKWASIRIANTEEMDILKECNPELLEKYTRSSRGARKKLSNYFMRDDIPWCVVAYPGKEWADKIFQSNAPNNVEKLNNVFKSILRLDKADPYKEWLSHSQKLTKRAETLNKLRLKKLHFTAENGDLTIYLNANSKWMGGPAGLPDGRLFIPNLPTEEVFTTPDFTKTEGEIKVTKPVTILGNQVDGIYLKFIAGKVVEFDAKTGRNFLEKYLVIDNGASFLGEVALVDNNSPINKSGLIFNNILFDENASCHIALGGGYPSCFTNTTQLTDDDSLIKAGCNVSLVHTDFMIGTDSTNVIGYDFDGNKFDIIKNGEFVI